MDRIWNVPIEQIGNIFYIFTLLLFALGLAQGHKAGLINLWDCVRSSDRDGKIFTDRRKLMEVVMFFVMTISFYYFSVTKQLTDTFVAIYSATALGAAAWRDREQRMNRLLEKKVKGNDNG